jgi:hypothetical protein
MACIRTTFADVVVVTEVCCALGKKALGILTRNHKAFFANAVLFRHQTLATRGVAWRVFLWYLFELRTARDI